MISRTFRNKISSNVMTRTFLAPPTDHNIEHGRREILSFAEIFGYIECLFWMLAYTPPAQRGV